MKAVILAAGEGIRLRPFTYSRPKGMLRIANKPILEYTIEALVANGVREIIMVVGYKRERIMSYFEDGKILDVKIKYITQPKQLGTAHALRYAKGQIDSEFLVLPGDNLIEPKVVSELLDGRGKVSMLITESSVPSKYGVVRIVDNIIDEIKEKPNVSDRSMISTGIYCLPPQVFDYIDAQANVGKHDLTSVMQHMIEQNIELVGVNTSGRWADAVYPWDMLKLNSAALLDAKYGISGVIEKDVFIKGKVSIGDGTLIRSGTYIQGPVAIGKGCEIGPHVVINPSTSIGDNVSIGPFSEIKNSIVMNDISIGTGSIISNSVIGDGVRIGPNFVASEGSAHVQLEAEFHDVECIGALIGDDSVLGSSIIAEPGTIIGASCKVSSGKRMSTNVPNNCIVV